MSSKSFRAFSFPFGMALFTLGFLFSAWGQEREALPLPPPTIPENPPFAPTVITSGGQRLLLEHTDVFLRYNRETRQLESSRPGWWIINHPLDAIRDLDSTEETEVLGELLGRNPGEVRNWYFRAPGEAGSEPESPQGPIRIQPRSPADLTVDNRHPDTSDENPGTADKPLRSINAAVKRAEPGMRIHVKPGIYRESVNPSTAGRADAPIVLEGITGPGGERPVITGNTPAPANAWQPVSGHPDLWRAENWTGIPANLALDGNNLRERTLPSELAPGEYSQNYAGRELAFPRLREHLAAGRQWSRREVDETGFLDLGETRGVYYLSTWLWFEPGNKGAEVWDPRFPQPLTGDVHVNGGFRAGRTSSLAFGSQLNLYRLAINGNWMPAAGRAGEPRANTDYGRDGDQWQRLRFQEGWNHLVILADSRGSSGVPNRIRFRVPRGRPDTVSGANQPGDMAKPKEGRKAGFVTEWMVLGPLPHLDNDRERALYLRVEPGQDPNRMALDLGERKDLVTLHAPFWTLRGFEIRHGTQYQQRAAVNLGAPGVVFEHNLVREPEVRAITLNISRFHHADPMMSVRGNWIVSPGGLGMGASGNTGEITPENLANPPGRGRVLIEHNHILDNNRSGYARFWESGAMKFFRMTGCVIRHNTLIAGDGPAIWLDWEHYNNRIEGNLTRSATAFAVGVEASPGPNLIANNVALDTQPGGQWFRYALLAWSSSRVWAVHNTIDGPHGMMFAEGRNNRGTAWGELAERPASAVNNLVIGRPVTLHRGQLGLVAGNFLYGPGPSGLQNYSRWRSPEFGQSVENSSQMRGQEAPPRFLNPDRADFRFTRGEAGATGGVAVAETTASGETFDLLPLARHDFHGLLRFPEDRKTVGAFRAELPADLRNQTILEIEAIDGAMERRVR